MADAVSELRQSSSPGRADSKRSFTHREAIVGLLFVLPGLTLAILFKLTPLLRGAWLSLLETRASKIRHSLVFRTIKPW